jgi:hypothetical protein
MNTNDIQSEGHLTPQDIAKWLVEGPSANAEAHLADCWTCQAKLVEAKEPLAVFRNALMAWSEGQLTDSARPVPAYSMRSWIWAPALSVALALAVLAGFLVGPRVFRDERTPQSIAYTPVSDSVLMEQVDSEVSEAVPDALAPLTDLVAWDSEEGASTVSPEKPAAKTKSAIHGKVKSKEQGVSVK